VKLKRLAIDRLPGIDRPFEIEGAGAGFHVVFGPNGIGKSSVCRAVEGLYWEDRGPSRPSSVTGQFELDGETWWGEREGAHTRWHRGDENNVSPNLPPSHHSRCFFLNLRDLIDPSRDGTADIASEIRRQMSGGFDLDKIASDLFAGVTKQRSRGERNDFNKAAENVQEAVGRHADLQRRADELGELRTQLHDAETAARRLALVERAVGLARRREELAAPPRWPRLRRRPRRRAAATCRRSTSGGPSAPCRGCSTWSPRPDSTSCSAWSRRITRRPRT